MRSNPRKRQRSVVARSHPLALEERVRDKRPLSLTMAKTGSPPSRTRSGPRIEPLSLEIHPIGVLLPGGGRSKPGDSSEFGFPSTAG